MDLPTTSSTKMAAPKDFKLAKLKSSLLASAALELNITMSSPAPAMKLVLSAKNAASCGRRAEVTIAHHLIHNLPTTPTPWTPPPPTPWPFGKSRLVVFHQVFPIPHLYLFPQTHEMADKHLTCPMVAQEEDRAPQESSSPAEPQELCMAQDLEMVVAEGMAPPQRILFPPEKICMAWQHSQRAGAGLHNLGNTCFLNSVLQCLTYTPPLANHLLSGEHSRACGQKGFCIMCRMEVHVQQVLHSSASAIEPWAVVDFLTVTCWSCQAVSDSYEAFLDVPLDIKAAASVTAALEDFVKPEHLDGENCFKCSKCDKVTAASKRFTVHRAPKVLTVCLKRFEAFTGDKISKVVEYPQYLDLRPYMSQAAGEPLLYSLYAVLVHGGGSCRAGHYFCYIKASDGLWYRMDDKSVDLCDSDTVLRQQAYLLFYISVNCRASSRLGLSLELGELQGVLSPDSSRPVKFSVCQSIWETSDPFLDLVQEISVSDQVKKAVTNRPMSSPVTGQESGCVMDLPATSSTKMAAPKDSKLAKLKSSLLASAALELNITMSSPPPAMKLVLSAKT
ncbi:hypothetical protein Q9966_012945 [Columba livia]|nr:hypothetical protein Q9966_012945 [Columba livia]